MFNVVFSADAGPGGWVGAGPFQPQAVCGMPSMGIGVLGGGLGRPDRDRRSSRIGQLAASDRGDCPSTGSRRAFYNDDHAAALIEGVTCSALLSAGGAGLRL